MEIPSGFYNVAATKAVMQFTDLKGTRTKCDYPVSMDGDYLLWLFKKFFAESTADYPSNILTITKSRNRSSIKLEYRISNRNVDFKRLMKFMCAPDYYFNHEHINMFPEEIIPEVLEYTQLLRSSNIEINGNTFRHDGRSYLALYHSDYFTSFTFYYTADLSPIIMDLCKIFNKFFKIIGLLYEHYYAS